MEFHVIGRIQASLEEKRRTLSEWSDKAAMGDKEICLGCDDDQPLQTHLQVIETALGKVHDQSLGVCKVCQGRVETALLEIDYTTSVCLECLSAEEKRHLENELELSRTLQRGLLPQHPPSIPGLELAAFSRPAQIVGGDYFDFFEYRGGVHGLTIADVMGHGVSSGLLMTGLQMALRTLVMDSDSPAEVLQRINHFYLHNINFTTFVTVFLACFDPSTRTLTYCNAGHNPPLVLSGADGNLSWLQPSGPAIGLVEEYHIEARTVALQPGDLLLLYTDGVTEAANPAGEEFGRDRLARVVQENRSRSVEDLVRAVRRSLHDFAAGRPLDDDTTIVAGRVTG
jgi:phosphoserine phosphatase RsbU/P